MICFVAGIEVGGLTDAEGTRYATTALFCEGMLTFA